MWKSTHSILFGISSRVAQHPFLHCCRSQPPTGTSVTIERQRCRPGCRGPPCGAESDRSAPALLHRVRRLRRSCFDLSTRSSFDMSTAMRFSRPFCPCVCVWPPRPSGLRRWTLDPASRVLIPVASLPSWLFFPHCPRGKVHSRAINTAAHVAVRTPGKWPHPSGGFARG